MEIINKNESSNKNDKSFILEKNTQIEIYDNSGRKLNLSICKQDIKILKYIGEVKTVDIYSAQSLSNKGIDIFDPDDKFFNDICHNYDNLDGKDMIIKDRRNDYFKNVSFCQYGCKYKGMNYSLMIANCVCDLTFIQEDFDNINLKNTESISFTDIKNTFLSNLLSFNLDVLRCFNLVFDKKTITKNIGFYCLFLMLILQIIFFIIYMTKKLNPLKHYMLNLNVQKRNINQNKNSINIINKKRFKKFSLSNNSKNKNKPSSKQIIKNELKSKDNNLMLSKLKIKSSKRFSNSYNLGRYINKKKLSYI